MKSLLTNFMTFCEFLQCLHLKVYKELKFQISFLNCACLSLNKVEMEKEGKKKKVCN